MVIKPMSCEIQGAMNSMKRIFIIRVMREKLMKTDIKFEITFIFESIYV